MIVVDTNLFLRFLTAQVPGADPALVGVANRLFSGAADESLLYTTSEAVIAEAVWVLSNQYRFQRSDVARGLSGLLTLPGCRMTTRRLCLDALDRWSSHRPALDFPDALVSTQAELLGAELATLDRQLARSTSAPIWAPDPAVP